MKRILLSVPHMGGMEEKYVAEAFNSNWLSTVGPNLTAFEDEFEQRIGIPSVAVASGTAAIHLGLRLLGVGPGDTVFCSTLTFAASANPIRYLGAEPVFIDSNRETWNMDPALLAQALRDASKNNTLPRAVVVVDLYGQCADMDPIRQECERYGVPILEDAAEALGATYKGKAAGTLADVAAFSFNGNKIITTTGGGMLVTAKRAWADKARFWSQQARDPGLAYQHSEIGYNYRMSNVLAGIGRGQLQVLELRVAQRRAIAEGYAAGLADIEGIALMPEAAFGTSTRWLSCCLVDAKALGVSRDELINALNIGDVESRPVWKPMHLQPLYAYCQCFGGRVAEELFRNGICLPSSSSLTDEEQISVINLIRRTAGAAPLPQDIHREMLVSGMFCEPHARG